MLALGIVLHIAAMIGIPIVAGIVWLLWLAISAAIGAVCGMLVILMPLAFLLGAINTVIVIALGICGTVFEFYCLTSIVMAILGYAKVFGPSEKEKISAEQAVADAPVEETVENTEK